MRGIESAVAVILLLIMSVALVAVLWMVFGPALKHTSQSTAKSMNKSAEQQARTAAIANEKAACDNLGENAVFETALPGNATIKLGTTNVVLAPYFLVIVNATTQNKVFNESLSDPICVYEEGGNYFIACWNTSKNEFKVITSSTSSTLAFAVARNGSSSPVNLVPYCS